MKTKLCSHCKHEYPATLKFFYKRGVDGGLQSWCIICTTGHQTKLQKTDAGKIAHTGYVHTYDKKIKGVSMSKPKTFADFFELYKQNTCLYPEISCVLAEELGVSADSLNQLGVGYDFKTDKENAPSWIFAERDDKGEIIGLIRRLHNGKKLAVEGSKRGLTYAINPRYGEENDRYIPGKHNWVRCRPGLACPICKREKWCMVSAEDLDNPPAVLCGTEEGSVGPCGESTFLHILRPEGIKTNRCETVLLQTELPILIVEGQTDVVAAADLGFVAIGRPSAQGGLGLLSKMPLHNCKVAVIGENDDGIGKKGMEAAYETIRRQTAQIVRLMPPDGVKDLRDWIRSGLTKDLLLAKIELTPTAPAVDVFENKIPLTIAKKWLADKFTEDGFPILKRYKKQWLKYVDGRYAELELEEINKMCQDYLEDKQCKKIDRDGGVNIVLYEFDKYKMDNILHMLGGLCLVKLDEDAEHKGLPVWLDDEKHPNPMDLIPFKNGILDFNEYMNGNIILHDSTPMFLNRNVLPYNFDESLESELWDNFLNDIFNDDQNKINLLAQWFGYNLVPDMSEEKFLMFVGRPSSGKSTVLGTMRRMLGVNQCSETNMTELGSRFGLRNFPGKLAVTMGEINVTRNLDSNTALLRLKAITGQDSLTVDRKMMPAIDNVYLKCRFTMAMNRLPAFSDDSRALERRAMILHFENSYMGREDKPLKKRLEAEAAAGKLTNFNLRGLKQLRENGEFTIPASSKDMLKTFASLTSSLHEFMTEIPEYPKDYPKEDPILFNVDKDILFDVWWGWCKANNNKNCGTKAEFFSQLKLNYATQITTRRLRIDGEKTWCTSGIRITNKDIQQYAAM